MLEENICLEKLKIPCLLSILHENMRSWYFLYKLFCYLVSNKICTQVISWFFSFSDRTWCCQLHWWWASSNCGVNGLWRTVAFWIPCTDDEILCYTSARPLPKLSWFVDCCTDPSCCSSGNADFIPGKLSVLSWFSSIIVNTHWYHCWQLMACWHLIAYIGIIKCWFLICTCLSTLDQYTLITFSMESRVRSIS